jgi:predicted Zn-dependent peptidase
VETDWQALQDFNRGQAEAYVRGHFQAGGSLAVAAADIPLPELEKIVREDYEGWSGGGRGATPPPVVGPPPTRSIQVFDRPGASQSTLMLGCRLDPVTAERLPAVDVLSFVLTGRASEMRLVWGATYGIHSRVNELPGAAHLIVEGAVETSRTGAAVERLLGLINEVATQGPDFKIFTLMRWDLARQFDQRFATPSQIASAVMRTRSNDWPLDVWERYPERLASLSRADVRAALAPCAGHEVITVVGDATAVKAQLREHHLDTEMTAAPSRPGYRLASAHDRRRGPPTAPARR